LVYSGMFLLSRMGFLIDIYIYPSLCFLLPHLFGLIHNVFRLTSAHFTFHIAILLSYPAPLPSHKIHPHNLSVISVQNTRPSTTTWAAEEGIAPRKYEKVRYGSPTLSFPPRPRYALPISPSGICACLVPFLWVGWGIGLSEWIATERVIAGKWAGSCTSP
jgi:hypothetical protein